MVSCAFELWLSGRGTVLSAAMVPEWYRNLSLPPPYGCATSTTSWEVLTLHKYCAIDMDKDQLAGLVAVSKRTSLSELSRGSSTSSFSRRWLATSARSHFEGALGLGSVRASGFRVIPVCMPDFQGSGFIATHTANRMPIFVNSRFLKS